jgi:hypothetical protein
VAVDHRGRRLEGEPDGWGVTGTQGAAENQEKDRAPQGEPH